MIDRHPVAIRIAHVDTEVLEELQAGGPRRDVPLELRRGARAEAGADAASEVEVREADHAVGMVARGNRVDATLQRRTGAAAQVDEHLQVECVHVLDDPVPAVDGDAGTVMTVDVDHGVPRAGDRTLLDDEGRARRVLLYRQRRLIRPAPAATALRFHVEAGNNDRDRRRQGGTRPHERPDTSLHSCLPRPPRSPQVPPQTGHKPNSVPRRRDTSRCRGDDHSSSPAIADGIEQPTRRLRTGRPQAPPYLVLLRAGFSLPFPLRGTRCALTAPFHPCRPAPGGAGRRYVFCATFLQVTLTGRYPAHCPAEFGLSSPPGAAHRSGRSGRPADCGGMSRIRATHQLPG